MEYIISPDRSLLRQSINKNFDLEEIQSICFDLRVDYDNLSGNTKDARVRALILEAEKKEFVSDLIDNIQLRRPNTRWEAKIDEKRTIKESESLEDAWNWTAIFEHFSKFGDIANRTKWLGIVAQEKVTQYQNYVQEQCSTTRVIGKPEPLSIEGIFTDVYVLDNPLAYRRYDIEDLERQRQGAGELSGQLIRRNALDLVILKKRLFVLGKPGAGKTTFLRYLALMATKGWLKKIPVFVSLHEWANSGISLIEYIISQFDICQLPSTQQFVERLLIDGNLIILLDGIDEIRESGELRNNFNISLDKLGRSYPHNRFVVTCRTATTQFVFEKFTYVEIADFTDNQISAYAEKWFGKNSEKAKLFLQEIQNPQNAGLRELAQTPILLTLLCLAFDETMNFPQRRIDIYQEATDALLTKWDSSRNIRRDETYKFLSLDRKKQLFARLAASYFQNGKIFFRKDDIIDRIVQYIQRLPGQEERDISDGEIILQSIEAQHGLLVERATNIYSFSHLTLQEYFTAKYVANHVTTRMIRQLVESYMRDARWREVLLLTVSMLDDADEFFEFFQNEIDQIARSDSSIKDILEWAERKSKHHYKYAYNRAVARSIARDVDVSLIRYRAGLTTRHTGDLAFTRDLCEFFQVPICNIVDNVADERRATDFIDKEIKLERDLFYLSEIDSPSNFKNIQQKLDNVISLAFFLHQDDLVTALQKVVLPETGAPTNKIRDFADTIRDISLTYRDIGHSWNLSHETQKTLYLYDRATLLMAECLRFSAVSDRRKIQETILMPPKPN